jgi:hypothetical protein
LILKAHLYERAQAQDEPSVVLFWCCCWATTGLRVAGCHHGAADAPAVDLSGFSVRLHIGSSVLACRLYRGFYPDHLYLHAIIIIILKKKAGRA